MQLSKQNIKKDLQTKILSTFYQLLSDIKNSDEAQSLLAGILTPAELITFAKRIAVAAYLEQGKSYEHIRNQLKVSSATIATVQGKLNEDNGLALALKKIQTDQWATKWAQKISNFLGGN